MKNITVIGVSGISGSGKTTLVKALAERLQAASLYWDDFDTLAQYPDNYVTWFENNGDYTEFNNQPLADTLRELRLTGTVTHPVTQERITAMHYIIVDAPLGKAHQQTSQYIDVFIHIDVPLDVALARRLLRDHQNDQSLQHSILDELSLYLTKSRPLFSEASMCRISHTADCIVDGMQPTSEQVAAVLKHLCQKPVLENLNIKINIVDKIDSHIENKMNAELMAYEAQHNVCVNYQRFSLVLSNNQNIVKGVLNAYTAFAEIYVDDLWVDEHHRGQGYGRMLLQALEDQFKGKGFNNINLVTSAFQAPEFYKKCGYIAEHQRYNEKNPKFTKTFFVKFFGEQTQHQGNLA